MDEFHQLKSLLLHEEAEHIAHLQEALNALVEETNDPIEIIKKTTPIINKIFSETIDNDRDGFIRVFSPIINELLENTIKNSSSEIAASLAPVMGKAISAQIKNQRDEIVDALYPIMGNMISKFVTESFKDMMNEINLKVQSTFSIEVIKRKVMAKIKGVSETELLLQSSTKSYSILTVFLIHKETGILISERSSSGEASIEPEMVASMLTAIRSFVNDWISQSNENIELNEIEFGDSTIRLEAAGCCYMATVLKGTINRAGQLKIVKVLENLVEANSDIITKFDGDVQTLPIEKINSELDTLFIQNDDISTKDEKSSPKKSFILWLVLVLILSTTSWLLYNSYISNKAELKIRSIIYKDPYLNLYSLNVKIEGSTIILSGRLPEKSLHEKLLLKVHDTLPNYLIDDHSVLTNSLPTDEQIISQIDSIINTLNMHDGNLVSYEFNKGILHLEGLVINNKIRQELNINISKINGVSQLISTLKNNPSGNSITVYYEAGKVLLEGDNKVLLDDWFEENKVNTLLNLYSDLNLLVIGYTDKYGYIGNNVYISNQRSVNIMKYLIEKGIPTDRIISIGVPHSQNNITANATIHERCADIKWIKR